MKFLRIFMIVMGFLIVAHFILYYIAIHDGTPVDATSHLIAGWFYFLKRNLEALSFDSAIFISGLVAAIIALTTLHLLARWLAKHFQFNWSFRSSISIFGFIIVLFATSFLVPGLLTVGKLMLSEPWVSRSRSTVDFEYQNQLRELNWSLLEADMIADGQLATWDIDSLITSSSLANSRSFQKGFANSGFLYPAAGLHPYEHEHLPLFISPEYMKRGKIVRSVIFSNSRIEDIDAQQMNELLKQVEVAHQHARENQ